MHLLTAGEKCALNRGQQPQKARMRLCALDHVLHTVCELLCAVHVNEDIFNFLFLLKVCKHNIVQVRFFVI